MIWILVASPNSLSQRSCGSHSLSSGKRASRTHAHTQKPVGKRLTPTHQRRLHAIPTVRAPQPARVLRGTSCDSYRRILVGLNCKPQHTPGLVHPRRQGPTPSPRSRPHLSPLLRPRPAHMLRFSTAPLGLRALRCSVGFAFRWTSSGDAASSFGIRPPTTLLAGKPKPPPSLSPDLVKLETHREPDLFKRLVSSRASGQHPYALSTRQTAASSSPSSGARAIRFATFIG